MSTLRLVRGDARTLRNKLDASGVPVPVMIDGVVQNLTGCTVRFMAKARKSDADGSAVISKAGVITNAVGGLLEVRLVKADTDSLAAPMTLYWDIQITNSLGEPITTDSGLLFIDADVDRGTP